MEILKSILRSLGLLCVVVLDLLSAVLGGLGRGAGILSERLRGLVG
jgi:hypothetical protein